MNDCSLLRPSPKTHCLKTDGEIPMHTHDDARQQRSTTGKYFPYESGINTCLAPAVFNTSGIFPRYTAWKKLSARKGSDQTDDLRHHSPLLIPWTTATLHNLCKINSFVFWKSFLEYNRMDLFLHSFYVHYTDTSFVPVIEKIKLSFFLSSFFFFLSSFPFITTVND